METQTNSEEKKKIFFKTAIIMTVLFALISLAQFCKHQKDEQLNANLISALQDTLKTFVDKDGLQHSEKQIIQTENPEDFIKLKTKDKEIADLQALVKQYKNELGKHGSAMILKTESSIDTSYSKATTIKDKAFTWKDSIHNRWLTFDYEVHKDSLNDKAQVQNSIKFVGEYYVINKEKSQGWFKKPIPYAEVVNKSPYSKTLSQTTYQVINDYRTKRFGVGPVIAYGVGLNFQPQVFFGAGVHWDLIQF